MWAYWPHQTSGNNETPGSTREIIFKTNHQLRFLKKTFWALLRRKIKRKVLRSEMFRVLWLWCQTTFHSVFDDLGAQTFEKKARSVFLWIYETNHRDRFLIYRLFLWKSRRIWSLGGKEKQAEFHQFRSDWPIYQGLCHKHIGFRSEMISICNGMV